MGDNLRNLESTPDIGGRRRVRSNDHRLAFVQGALEVFGKDLLQRQGQLGVEVGDFSARCDY